jgi:hypothetical protein
MSACPSYDIKAIGDSSGTTSKPFRVSASPIDLILFLKIGSVWITGSIH